MATPADTGSTDLSCTRYIEYDHFVALLEGIVHTIENANSRRIYIGKLWAYLYRSPSLTGGNGIIMVCPVTMIECGKCPLRNNRHHARVHRPRYVFLDVSSFLETWPTLREHSPRMYGPTMLADLSRFATWLCTPRSETSAPCHQKSE